MRNQAQTHQVELTGSGNFTFSIGLAARPSDWDGDGIPNEVEDGHGFLDPFNAGDGSSDQDDDGTDNTGEYIAGSDMNDPLDFPRTSTMRAAGPGNGITLSFDTELGRLHYIWYSDSLLPAVWTPATTPPLQGTGGRMDWTDDGSGTDPDPTSRDSTQRFYRIEYQMEE